MNPEGRFDVRRFAAGLLLSGAVALAAAGATPTDEDHAQSLAPVMFEVEELLLRARERREAGDSDAAEDAYLDGLSILEAHHGELSELLIEPLIELGEAYNEAGQHLQAMVVMDRARHLGRRNYGLYTPAQLPALWGLVEAHAGLGDNAEVRNWLEEIELHAARAYEDDPESLLAVHHQRAAWYARHGYGYSERDVYEQMLDISAEAFPGQHFRRQGLLLQIAESWQRQTPAAMRFSLDRRTVRQVTRRSPTEAAGRAEARAAIEQAGRVLEEQSEVTDAERADVALAWADWHLIWTRTPDEAIDALREAWRLLASEPELRERRMGRAQPIYFVPPASPDHLRRGERRSGHVRVEFTIGPDGRAHDIEVVDADPAGLLEADTVAQLERTGRYRPRFVDGVPVATPGVQLTQRFTYPAPEGD